MSLMIRKEQKRCLAKVSATVGYTGNHNRVLGCLVSSIFPDTLESPSDGEEYN